MSVELHLKESVALTSAAVQFIADRAGIRILHLKGAAAAELLRLSRHSSDVDILVHPEEWSRLVSVLETVGFMVHQEAVLAGRGHSVDLVSPCWGAGVDVHHRFPGIEAPADVAFEALWARRTPVRLAGSTCQAPERVAHALLLVLHSARSPENGPKWAEGEFAWQCLSTTERQEFRDLAVVLQAEEALGVRLSDFSEQSTPEMRRLWRARAERDAEAVWWMRLAGSESPREALAWMVSSSLLYLRVLRLRYRQDWRGAVREVLAKASRLLRAGTRQIRHPAGRRGRNGR